MNKWLAIFSKSYNSLAESRVDNPQYTSIDDVYRAIPIHTRDDIKSDREFIKSMKDYLEYENENIRKFINKTPEQSGYILANDNIINFINRYLKDNQ